MKLDIGCGLRRKSSEHLGLDISKHPNVNIIASANFLPFRNESFSDIYSRRCVQHIQDDEKAISEVSRVLQENGEAKLILASWRGWLFYQIKWLLKRRPYQIFHIYTFRKLKRIFQNKGFRSIRVGKIKSIRKFGYDIIIEATKEESPELKPGNRLTIMTQLVKLPICQVPEKRNERLDTKNG